ncbi:Uncharacterized protein PECH_000315 [Penicillium ucsense]|uniref:Cellular morphogenesis protein n=1 Tax=Penicillium ucsense TaxID=2839758 RepID=A0A8J8VYJ2_9EURO|nr:Uncharacterized protein PECM_008688 [Penicillium ucsense]KAF7733718.1 Uncharacterized protein PECH_000315 [Penicillium ucsense]
MKASSLYGLAAAGISATWPTVHALTFDAVSIPEINLASLGRVTITGDFDGVSLYEYEGQTQTTQRQGSSLLTPLPNGILTSLSSANAQIRDMCAFTKQDGTFAGIFVGGNFTKLGNVESTAVALFHPNTSDVTALPGLQGSVSSVLCDQDANRVYVGGDFSYKNSSNAIYWSPTEGWTELMFDGLNGPVNSIIKRSDGHIIFGGSFDGLGNMTSASASERQQVLNLQTATVTADAESSLSGFTDPRNVICSTSGEAGPSKTWLLHDYAPGFWRADLGFTFQPTKLRLYNTHFENRGTKSFLLRALPDTGIMNLTYTDDSGNVAHCDASCQLPESSQKKYRDFTLVNPVGMRGFQIEILDWWGQGAGLNGIEVFQDQIKTYAVNAFNEPACAGLDFPSKSTHTGSWTVKDAGYLSASVTKSNDSSTSVVLYPDIKESGNYTIFLHTPGCVQDSSCSSRGSANVTVNVTKGKKYPQPPSMTKTQTNNDNKIETLYSGHVDASSGSFRPAVTIQPVPGQGDLTFVAGSVEFVLLSQSTSTDGLNGLYDYDPSARTTPKLDSSAVNKAGNALDRGAVVMSLIETNGAVYIGGNFSTERFHNIMTVSDGNATALPGGSLNSEVFAMAALNDVMYVGGQFTATTDGNAEGLSYIASYSVSNKKWSPLGAGLNGQVRTIFPIQLNVSSAVNETIIAVSGDFDQIRATADQPAVPVAGFAIWVPSKETWLQHLNSTQMEFAGQVSAVASVNGTSILAGNLATDGLTASSAVSLLDEKKLSLLPLPLNIDHTATMRGINSGVYDTESNRNLTILGGHFTALGSNGSVIHNVAILNGTEQRVTGLPSGLNSNSTVHAMAVHNNTLYVAGVVTGTIGGSSVSGMVAYDLSRNSFKDSQPWSLNGKNASVSSIAVRPGSSELFVGGNFESAGSLPCTTVCSLDSSLNQWSWPGASISGTVMSLVWANADTLYAVGDMEISNNKTVVATFSKKTSDWTVLSGASPSEIPGNVTAFAPANEEVSNFWIAGSSSNGSAFLLKYDGSKFQSTGSLFAEGTRIRDLEVLPLNKDHSSATLLNNNQALLVLGELVIPDFGNASAALYNGTAVTPFILSSKQNGEPGSMSRLIMENNNPFTTEKPHHSNGIVVLVAFCCALGCVFLIVAAGVIANKIQRRRQGYSTAPQTFGTDRPSDMQRVPPEYLFNSLRGPPPGAPVL